MVIADSPRLAQGELDGLDLEAVELELHREGRVLGLEQVELLALVFEQVRQHRLRNGDVARYLKRGLRVTAIGLVETEHDGRRRRIVLAEVVVQPALDGFEDHVRGSLDAESGLGLQEGRLGGVIKQTNCGQKC